MLARTVLKPSAEGLAFEAGVTMFNAHQFWEAHEAWEELWLAAEGDLVEFYQGLIQLAAAYHHVKRGTFSGGVRLFDSALRRLAPFPAGFHDLDRESAVSAALLHRSAADAREKIDASQFPKLTLITR